jgi:hypothetical protein
MFQKQSLKATSSKRYKYGTEEYEHTDNTTVSYRGEITWGQNRPKKAEYKY